MAQQVFVPTDANGNVLNRAMGVPVSFTRRLGSGTDWCDIGSLAAYAPRVFIGMTAKNPSGALKVEISFDEDIGEESANITVSPNESVAFDGLTFGPGVVDFTQGTRTLRLRGRLSGNSGTLSSATIVYAGNPTNGQTVRVNGRVYEFSSDLSVEPGRVKVDIKASADLTWTEFAAMVGANSQGAEKDGNCKATIDTGTNTVTVYSTKGGTDGDGMQVADGLVNPTGATFSGNTTGGAGGVEVVINIW